MRSLGVLGSFEVADCEFYLKKCLNSVFKDGGSNMADAEMLKM